MEHSTRVLPVWSELHWFGARYLSFNLQDGAFNESVVSVSFNLQNGAESCQRGLSVTGSARAIYPFRKGYYIYTGQGKAPLCAIDGCAEQISAMFMVHHL